MLMANSVEGRFPFLDHDLISFANSLHPKHKMRALNEKALLKRAMKDRLPPSILKRYKQPYRGPGAGSFLGDRGRELAATLLSPDRLAGAGCFNAKAVSRLQTKVERGAQLGERDNMAYIGILSTQAWYYWFVEGEFGRATAAQRPAVNANVEV
jgi:asparagine synthase (glutamine-hydrolysing)